MKFFINKNSLVELSLKALPNNVVLSVPPVISELINTFETGLFCNIGHKIYFSNTLEFLTHFSQSHRCLICSLLCSAEFFVSNCNQVFCFVCEYNHPCGLVSITEKLPYREVNILDSCNYSNMYHDSTPHQCIESCMYSRYWSRQASRLPACNFPLPTRQ